MLWGNYVFMIAVYHDANLCRADETGGIRGGGGEPVQSTGLGGPEGGPGPAMFVKERRTVHVRPSTRRQEVGDQWPVPPFCSGPIPSPLWAPFLLIWVAMAHLALNGEVVLAGGQVPNVLVFTRAQTCSWRN